MIIAVAQIKLSVKIEENLRKVIRFSKKASRQKVNILCFPECALTGYIRNFRNLDLREIEKSLDRLQDFAEKEKMNLIIGTHLKKGSKLFNCGVVLLKDGKKFIYRKQNLTEFDKKFFSPGKENLIFRINGTRYGVAICRDQNYSEIFQDYKKRGVKMVFLLSAHYYPLREAKLKIDKNKALPIVRALDSRIFIAKADAVGKVKNKRSYGGSIIVDPKGVAMKEAKPGRESILTAKVT